MADASEIKLSDITGDTKPEISAAEAAPAAAAESTAPIEAAPAAMTAIDESASSVATHGAEPAPAVAKTEPTAEPVASPDASIAKAEAPAIAASPISPKPDAAAAWAAALGKPGDKLGGVRPGSDLKTPRYRATFGRFIPTQQPAMLAASLGFACALGLLMGALGTFGVGRLLASPNTAPAVKSAAVDETRALKQTVAQMQSQLASLKSSIDHSSKTASSQTTRLAERFDRDAHSQSEMQTRLNKIGETVDRLERRVAIALAPDTTGSVTPQRLAPTPTPTPAPRLTSAPATTPPAAPQPPVVEAKKATPQIVDGWVVRDVFRGRALVASRRGMFEAAPGLELPGLGHVESVKRQDGQWVVVTEKGLIVASRGQRTHYRFED